MTFSGFMDGVRKCTSMDEIDLAANLLTPCVSYLACYSVTVLIGTPDPITALVTATLMSIVDMGIGAYSNFQYDSPRNLKDAGFTFVAMVLIPVVALSVLSVSPVAAVVYTIIAVSSRTFVLYQAAAIFSK